MKPTIFILHERFCAQDENARRKAFQKQMERYLRENRIPPHPEKTGR